MPIEDLDLIFRTNGAWGAGKGANLTKTELDENFYNLAVHVAALEDTPIQPTSIDTIEVVGGQMTITLTDATVLGPFNLPVAVFNPRGDWTALEDYSFLDLVTEDTLGTYMVLQDHTAAATFDPDLLIGGDPVYHLLFPPGAAGPAGADGADGADGAPGEQGPRGIFFIDAEGLFSTRGAYDDEAEGFTFLSLDGAAGGGGPDVLYQMGSGGTADWVGPYTWQGETGAAGAAGAAGAQGPAGTSADWDEQGDFAGRDAFDAEAEGFRYLSSNGDDGATTEQTSIFVRDTAVAGVWQGPFIWQGPQGETGLTGATGPQGPEGQSFQPDATGLFADRSDYDLEAPGFSFLSTNGDGASVTTAVVFWRLDPTGWSAANLFQGPVGPEGPEGPQGPAGPTGATGASGTNFNVNATGTFAGRAAFDAQATNFRYLSTNGDGSGHPTTGQASIYIKASAAIGDWGPRIPFAGPKGDTGPQGPTGAAGAPGAQGAAGEDGVGVPAGGTTGQVLAKASDVDFATEWVEPSAGGSAGRELKTVSTDTYTFVSGDETKYIRFTHASGCAATLNDAVFAQDDELVFRGTLDQVTVVAGAGVTINTPETLLTRKAHSTAHLFMVAADEADLTGDLEAA